MKAAVQSGLIVLSAAAGAVVATGALVAYERHRSSWRHATDLIAADGTAVTVNHWPGHDPHSPCAGHGLK